MEPLAPVIKTPYLDAVEAELRLVSPGLEGSVWERTSGNAFDAASLDDPASWILQVPDCWGWTQEGLCPPGADKPGIRALLGKMRANISTAERTVDITGFGIFSVYGSPVEQFPDGHFAQAIVAGLKAAARAAVLAGRRLKVRILAGVPSMDITASPWGFRDRLRQMIGADFDAIDINVAAMSTRGGTSYNHTKLVVVDGISVIHGGINWMTNYYIEDGTSFFKGYGGVAPVTDLDLAPRGPAATSAGKFLDVLWAWTCDNASIRWQLGVGAWLATKNDRMDECIRSLYSGFKPAAAGDLQVISVGSLGYGIAKNDPTSKYQLPAAGKIDQGACYYWGLRVGCRTMRPIPTVTS